LLCEICCQCLFFCWHSTVMLNLQKKTCWQTWWVSEISCILFLVFPIVELEARHQTHNGDPKFLLPAACRPRGPIVFISSDLTFWGQEMWAKPVFLLLRNYTLVQKRLTFSFLDWLFDLSSSGNWSLTCRFFESEKNSHKPTN
jgi:hypothetical protein